MPRSHSFFSSATASVDLPEPDRPVSQIVQPLLPEICSRSALVTTPACHVMLRDFGVLIGTGLPLPPEPQPLSEAVWCLKTLAAQTLPANKIGPRLAAIAQPCSRRGLTAH